MFSGQHGPFGTPLDGEAYSVVPFTRVREMPSRTGPDVGDLFLCDTLDLLRRRPPGGRPPGAQNGKDVFGCGVGQAAVVEALEPGAVMVRLSAGSWKGRTGWVRPDGVRRGPTPEERAADVVRGLDQLRRREISKDEWASGMAATEAAEARYPLSQSPRPASQCPSTAALRARGLAPAPDRHGSPSDPASIMACRR
jgi:hypothetical protein